MTTNSDLLLEEGSRGRAGAGRPAGGAVDHQHAEARRRRACTRAAPGRGGASGADGSRRLRSGPTRGAAAAGRSTSAISRSFPRVDGGDRADGVWPDDASRRRGGPRGAAASAPKPDSSSTAAADVLRGRRPGPKAANSDVSALPSTWAVPVLPAIGKRVQVEAVEGAVARCPRAVVTPGEALQDRVADVGRQVDVALARPGRSCATRRSGSLGSPPASAPWSTMWGW